MNFAFQKDINKLRTLQYFMSEKVIDTMGPIKFGWNTLKANLKFFVVLMTIVGIASFLPQLASFILPFGESSSWWPLSLLIFARSNYSLHHHKYHVPGWTDQYLHYLSEWRDAPDPGSL